MCHASVTPLRLTSQEIVCIEGQAVETSCYLQCMPRYVLATYSCYTNLIKYLRPKIQQDENIHPQLWTVVGGLHSMGVDIRLLHVRRKRYSFLGISNIFFREESVLARKTGRCPAPLLLFLFTSRKVYGCKVQTVKTFCYLYAAIALQEMMRSKV